MTLIDLLNKMANDEEVPKKVIIDNRLFIYDENRKKYQTNNGHDISSIIHIENNLNTKVEIIEEYEPFTDKPKKIEEINHWKNDDTYLVQKIDELTSAVNYLLDKSE